MAKEKNRKQESLRPIDRHFIEYAKNHQHTTNVLLQWIFVPLLTFSILGLIWAIPLQFTFLGKFKDYFNIASIVIGIVMYFYLKLSPTLSYAMLLTVGVFSFFIVQLEYWERAGGLAFWLVCLILFVVACIGQLIGHKIEGRKPSSRKDLRFLLIGPIWLWSKLFKKLRIPY